MEGGGYYYEALLDYIHLNPVRAGLVNWDAGLGLLDYPWSSAAGGYALMPGKRAGWLAAADGLKAFGCADTAKGRRAWLDRLERRAAEEEAENCGLPASAEGTDARHSNLVRGWYWGSQGFAEGLRRSEKPCSKRRVTGTITPARKAGRTARMWRKSCWSKDWPQPG